VKKEQEIEEVEKEIEEVKKEEKEKEKKEEKDNEDFKDAPRALCRGRGHVSCGRCYFVDGRFGRHPACTRNCSTVDGTWGPASCVSDCQPLVEETNKTYLTMNKT